MDDIAVIGIGLRFPGDAASPEELWGVLERGESQWSEFPKDRLNIDGYFHPSGDRQGSISFKGAHFLKDNIAAFDAPFFSVSADDAKAIDPQQRILLEASYEALENAGLRKEDIDGSDTAVYVGSFVKDYEQICLRDPDWQPQYAATGNGIAIMANRISYAFNFHGPSMTIDTGCSGSLVSVHLAAQSLRTGESSLALAAGAGMILTPNTIMPMTALNFLSPDGKCFTFDARANGYGRGEGIGVVVLKRLADALRDNDTIRAVIRGTAVNQDGRTTGITLPSKEAQVANIKSVYASAGLSFDQTGYVECHGTGTQAGDWRELKAISETLGSARGTDNPIYVGSVKPNIGHLEGAAGVAGLIKGVLVLEHGKIPPNINFANGNPDIDFEEWKVKVPRSVTSWPLSGSRRVSVNCFGFGGTNAHVIMDEAPAYLTSRRMIGHHNSLESSPSTNGRNGHVTQAASHVFCFSSNEKSGVRRVMQSHLPYLESARMSFTPEFLENFSYTLGCRRSNMEWKGAIVASSMDQLISKLKAVDQIPLARSSLDKPPRICFVFCGQGSQWAGMGKDLIDFTAFRESLEAASYFMQIHLGSPWNLLQEMFLDERESRISQSEISQPATTALQVALVDLLPALSIKPSHVIGHSSGEIAAAYASGAITREAAWEIAYYRGVVAASISIKSPKLKGGMIAVGTSAEDARTYIEALNLQQPVQIACINSPSSVTLSGHADAIAFIANDLGQKGIFHRVLPVQTAYHSKYMELVEQDYRNYLKDLKASNHKSRVAMFSSVTGSVIKGTELAGAYWAANMVSPVQYVSAVEEMMKAPAASRPDVMLEIGPRASLQTSTSEILTEMGLSPALTLLSVLQRKVDGETSLLQTVGDLWTKGCPVDTKYAITHGRSQRAPKCLVDLPPYPWNHAKTYWHESHLGEANRFRQYPRQDLIGAPTADSITFEPRWRGFLRMSENPWIQDHQVQKTIVYPAAGMISMVLEGAKQMAGQVSSLRGYEISDMTIEKVMMVPSTAHGLEMALNIKRDTGQKETGQILGLCEFAIYSKQLDGPWERNATGVLRFSYADGDTETISHVRKEADAALDALCTQSLVPRQLYELLDTVGMNYGPLFQNIVDIRKGGRSCMSRIRIPDTKSKMPAQFEYPHILHPATLDSMFQTLFAIEPEPMVPTFIESIFVSADISNNGDSQSSFFHGSSTAERKGVRDATADISMQLGDTQSYVTIRGLQLTGIGTSTSEEGGFLPNHRNLCTEVGWKEDVASWQPEQLLEYLQLWAHKYPGMSILHIGSTSSLALTILARLLPAEREASRLFRYSIADLTDDGDVTQLITHFSGTPLANSIEAVNVDGSTPLAEYDLILDHRGDFTETSHLAKHLKSYGRLIPITMLGEMALVSPVVETNGASHSTKELPFEVVLLHPDSYTFNFSDFVQQLAGVTPFPQLGHLAFTLLSITDATRDPSILTGKVVLSLLDFADKGQQTGFFFYWEPSDFTLFHAVQKVAKGIVWLTQGAHMECQNPKASPIIALARTLMSEDPLKTIVTLDLSSESNINDLEVSVAIARAVLQTFVGASNNGIREMEYAEKDGKLYIPRLNTIDPLNKIIEGDITGDVVKMPFRTDSSNTALKLEIAKPGLTSGALHFSSFETNRDLEPDEVEIAFSESVLAFSDLETALGRTSKWTVGMDVTGHIIRKGTSVDNLEVGSKVTALVPGGSLQTSIIANSHLVTPYREGIVPSCLVSAYYGLSHVGRAGRDTTVLIHAGASIYGLAAIELCLFTGGDVFVTVMGTESKEQIEVLERTCPADRIIDASSEAFVDVVLERTGGRGVDIVYNPTQEHVELGHACVQKGGTIVQFADKSASPHVFRSGLTRGSFVNLDLAQMMVENVSLVSDMLHQSLRLIGYHRLNAWSSPKFGIGELEDAFKHIQRAPYLNHVSITAGDETSGLVPVRRQDATKSLRASIDPDGTYVLAGGLGGLGRSICEMLVNNGARYLAFLSRSGASSEQSQAFLQSLADHGVMFGVYQVDICDKTALQGTIESLVARDMPPIRGVFQCAAVIKDAVFDNMTYEDWMIAAGPKMAGSWNLAETITHAGQDPFFIFLASSAGVIGNRGQANYAAGNCFEDALSRYLRLHGKHAVSIDLGPVLGAGMLAEDEGILDMLKASGFYGIRHEDFLKIVEHAITMETLPGIPMPAQVTLGVGTGGLLEQNQPADPYWSRTALYSYLNLVDMPPPDLSLSSDPSSKLDMKAMLACCTDISAAVDIVCAGLMHMLAKAMNMLFEEMDGNKPPNSYGVDSLVAVGVRNWVLSNTGVQVSVFEVLSDKTIAELAGLIAEKGGFGLNRG